MSSASRKLLLALFLFFASACASETKTVAASTQVLVHLDAQSDLRPRIDRLSATLWVAGSNGWTRRSQASLTKAQLRWPLDLPIIAGRTEDERAQIEVIIEASGAGVLLAQARIVTFFVPQAHVQSEVTLHGCPGHPAGYVCAGDECHGSSCTTCSPSGECVAAGQTAAQPELDAGGARGPENDAGSTSDADSGPSSDAQTHEGAQTGDAAADAAADDAAANVADASADAQVRQTTDAATFTHDVCPVDNRCAAPYACATTTLGYTCLGQHADWPMPDAMPGSKVKPSYSSNGRVAVDEVTGLQWQLQIPSTYPNCSQMYPDSGGFPGQLCTQAEARDYCARLVWDGLDDWRLPSMIELASLFDTYRPAAEAGIDTAVFGDTDVHVFVSESMAMTGVAPFPSWGVNFKVRLTILQLAFPGQVRCVRAGRAPPFATPNDRYIVDVASDTVADRATGLVWQRTVSPTLYSVAEAEKHCPAGLRMPTPNELLTLVEPTRINPAVDTTTFPATPSQYFWASLKASVHNCVDFTTGELARYEGPASVRCVK
ncbi:MAG: putative secreted protein [Myxococcaceae bacterium]|nr:putative secreted protein [Myxococcaceae bacterium]